MFYNSGAIKISGKGVHMYNGMHVCVGSSLCWFYLMFLNYPLKMK